MANWHQSGVLWNGKLGVSSWGSWNWEWNFGSCTSCSLGDFVLAGVPLCLHQFSLHVNYYRDTLSPFYPRTLKVVTSFHCLRKLGTHNSTLFFHHESQSAPSHLLFWSFLPCFCLRVPWKLAEWIYCSPWRLSKTFSCLSWLCQIGPSSSLLSFCFCWELCTHSGPNEV